MSVGGICYPIFEAELCQKTFACMPKIFLDTLHIQKVKDGGFVLFLVKQTDSLLSYLDSKGKLVHRVDQIFNILKMAQ